MANSYLTGNDHRGYCFIVTFPRSSKANIDTKSYRNLFFSFTVTARDLSQKLKIITTYKLGRFVTAFVIDELVWLSVNSVHSVRSSLGEISAFFLGSVQILNMALRRRFMVKERGHHTVSFLLWISVSMVKLYASYSVRDSGKLRSQCAF